MNTKIYYNYQRVMSYNANMNIIIGERGVGKSYGLKKFYIKYFLKTGKQIIYLRRYQSELENSLKDNYFFKDIKNDKDLIGHKFETIGEKLIIDGKIFGYGMALSKASTYKSIPYPNIVAIMFDEFLIEEGIHHYLKNEPKKVLDLLETVFRLRNIKIFMLGNNISIVNPYFEYFKLYVPYNSDIKLFNDNTILVQYIENKAFRTLKEKSSLGKLIKNTDYKDYNTNNKSLIDNSTFIEKKSKSSKFFFNILLNGIYYGVWLDNKTKKMFISTKYNLEYRIILTFNVQDHTSKNTLLNTKSVFFKNLITHYELGILYFENQTIKTNILNLIYKSKKWY